MSYRRRRYNAPPVYDKSAVETQPWAVVFSQANTILARRPIKVLARPEGQYSTVSYTDGEVVVLNTDRCTVFTDHGLYLTTALDYHELAHIMFTPRRMYEWCNGRAMSVKDVMNLLEDHRIEHLMIGRFPSTRPYFVGMVAHYITGSNTIETVWPLLAGRWYLPKSIRDAAKAAWQGGPAEADKIESLILEYRAFTWGNRISEAQKERAVDIAAELQSILNSVPQMPSVGCGNPDITQGRNVAQEEVQESQEWGEYFEAEQEDEDAEAEANGDDADADDGDDDSDSDDDGTSTGTGSGDSDDDDETDDDDDDTDANGTGTGAGADSDSDDDADDGDADDVTVGAPDVAGSGGDGTTLDDILQQIQEAVDEAMSSDDVQADLRTARDNIRQLGGYVNLPTAAKKKPGTVDTDMVFASLKLQRVLESAEADADPGWVRNVSSGRLSVKALIEGRPFDQMWDQWTADQVSITDMEVVILVDVSSSMSSLTDITGRNLWIIRRALQNVGAEVRVLAFGDVDQAYSASDIGSRVEPTHYDVLSAHAWGTAPSATLQEARRVLSQSTRKVKIVAVLTDGAWHDEAHANDILASMTKEGTHTVAVGLGYRVDQVQAEAAQMVRSADDLVALFQDLVTTIQKTERV